MGLNVFTYNNNKQTFEMDMDTGSAFTVAYSDWLTNDGTRYASAVRS